ncbi:hypothetical protein RHGRI_021318 [Rhododendron griersonianum]|uniref:EF-hand domain-containing protein n=1 Tax=Rhododendron griersonianum TaxID=479676 RepID=A0AAV6JN38_9ERIC|nr:hypothetical protein RHGRI_021318 [Rhododendron griersonianum]
MLEEESDKIFLDTNLSPFQLEIDWESPPKFDEYPDEEEVVIHEVEENVKDEPMKEIIAEENIVPVAGKIARAEPMIWVGFVDADRVADDDGEESSREELFATMDRVLEEAIINLRDTNIVDDYVYVLGQFHPAAAEERSTGRNELILEEDGDDVIGLEEFTDFAARNGGGESNNNNNKEIGDAFEMYDRDRNEMISAEEWLAEEWPMAGPRLADE